jgi:hypothetical protein
VWSFQIRNTIIKRERFEKVLEKTERMFTVSKF